MRNLRLELCYDGSRYRGWQRLSKSDNTIQGKIEGTLSKILGEPIEISASGRTDAGTHALGQVANFHCRSTMPASQIMEQLCTYLPEDIGIYSVKDVSERFHARLNAKEKTYRYRVWTGNSPCIFERKYVFICRENFVLQDMQTAASYFIGQHDFKAFCSNKKGSKSTIRYIRSFTVQQQENELIFTVTGNGFLHHMVRIMVGTLLEVGRGERKPESIADLFQKERAETGLLIPARGLCLMEVVY